MANIRRVIKPRLSLWLIAVVLLVGGCAKEPLPTGLIRLSPSEYPVFADDLNYADLDQGIAQSLNYLRRIPGSRPFKFGSDAFDAAHIIRSLERFMEFIEKKPSQEQITHFIREHYLVYKSSGEPKTGKVLFTGYYEPLLRGSLCETPEYPYPIYGPPDDLAVVDLSSFSAKFEGEKIIGRVDGKTFVPYHDRKEIDQERVLTGKAPELAWVKDPVDIFFLHIQGSGKIMTEDGALWNVHYHSKNGRPYRSVGQLLIDEDKVPAAEMSMQKIRAYLQEHPEEITRVLNYNPSYVFFTFEKEGPLGAIQVPLTPGRSMAVDRTVFPLSVLSFIMVQKPVLNGDSTIREWVDFSRFVLNQDTGGAIKGLGRADIFWGAGDYAEMAAGHMKHRGDLYLLVLKPESL
jgi:membrane-bound lytic murein transglycosylase A